MSTRRLAAIMFTDIVGYSQSMQKSEANAIQLRNRHREVFERFHAQFNGEILQYYGDGTMSIFDSCVEAVQCAIAMQREFQNEPSVPLRIGIHLGDIVLLEDDILGNGVNIASRVESLGAAGAVLISEDVRKQIENQEIETVFIGRFKMKNITIPMALYAIKASGIVLPQPKNIKGKGKRVAKNTFSNATWLRLISIGFFAMAFGATLFWAMGWKQANKKGFLEEKVRQERVAVIPFINFSGDASLDAFSSLSSGCTSNFLFDNV